MKKHNSLYATSARAFSILAANSKSLTNLRDLLNLYRGGRQLHDLKRMLLDTGTSTEHWKSQPPCVDDNFFRKYSKEEINNRRFPNSVTYLGMRERGIERKCGECGITKHNGKNITFEIDHRDGDFANYTLENLRFLCPNCHSQQETSSSSAHSLYLDKFEEETGVELFLN